MLRIHQEGKTTLLLTAIVLLAINVGFYFFANSFWTSAGADFSDQGSLAGDSGGRFWSAFWRIVVHGGSVVLFGLVLQFFRNPARAIPELNDRLVYAPADGRVVVIEPTRVAEYLEEDRIQISIFMSPLNVHVNRNPVGGRIAYQAYHPGKYLVAWHPKSSELNERTTIVYDTGRHTLLMRQIAGAVARRIVCYPRTGDQVVQGADMGFIKFGSRVDLFLPLDAEILVEPEQVVTANRTLIARMPA